MSDQIKEAVERVSLHCPGNPPAMEPLDQSDLATILAALSHETERASIIKSAIYDRCAERDALAERVRVLEVIGRNICDAATQDDAGQWIITGDAEMMLSDLSSALTPSPLVEGGR